MTAPVQAVDKKLDFLQVQKVRDDLRKRTFQDQYDQAALPQEVISDFMDGVLILTDKIELIYANDYARRILRQLNHEPSQLNQIPDEVTHICQALVESRHLFPNQYWLIESKVLVDPSIVFNIRARWLKLDDREQPCLLFSIRDQCQYIKDIANEESRKYRLTSREKEIWLLHRANYTYKQIAVALCITPNTVKKHMKGIYLKQKTLHETLDTRIP